MPSVHGHYLGPARRPYVYATVTVPRLGMSADVKLLVDTGADRTCIHWDDRQALKSVDGSYLPADAAFLRESAHTGIAERRVRYGVDDGRLAFLSEAGEPVSADLPLAIALDPIHGVPSLLGRDFLERFRLDFDMPAGRLVLTRSGG